MAADNRAHIIAQLINQHVGSPSLKHIRHHEQIHRLANDIIASLDRENSLWHKWEGARDALARSAATCWIPTGDLKDYLNRLKGPPLTSTDVVQRLGAIHEETCHYPQEELQAGCLIMYEQEKRQGTELPAIIRALEEHVFQEEERLREEREAARRRQIEEDRQALEERFLSGADCKWTQLQRSKELYCRVNGRSFRLTPTSDRKLNLYRIQSVDDDRPVLIGKYLTRGAANKALAQVAYQPESRW